MSVIKAIFHDTHVKCLIPKSKHPKEYKLGNIAKPEVYSVDCLFQYSKRGGKRCDEFVFFGGLIMEGRCLKSSKG